MSVPASVSFLWHVTDRVAIRPEIDLSGDSADLSLGVVDHSEVSPGASVLFYTTRWETVRSYVAPRYLFSRSTASGTSEAHTNRHEFGGSVGVQYTPHRRFGVFGEVGLAFATTKSEADGLEFELKTTSWGVRSSVGAILYF